MEMDPKLKKDVAEAKKLFKKEFLQTYLLMFIFQLVIGSYAIYTAYLEYEVMGFWKHSFLLVFGAALIGLVLTIAAFVIMIIVGSIVVGFQLWLESRKNG